MIYLLFLIIAFLGCMVMYLKGWRIVNINETPIVQKPVEKQPIKEDDENPSDEE